MTLPSDVTNIILEYYSQLNNMKWQPFIETSSGKLKWKVNKYSIKYRNINRIYKGRDLMLYLGLGGECMKSIYEP